MDDTKRLKALERHAYCVLVVKYNKNGLNVITLNQTIIIYHHNIYSMLINDARCFQPVH